MNAVWSGLMRFIREEDAPTAVEYAVMLALIIVVCLLAISTVGTQANEVFTDVGTALQGGTGGSGT